MGCDISILSRHTLDTSSIERLAADLSKRLNMNIEYGYYAFEEYSRLLGEPLQEDFVPLGTIQKEGTAWHYRLIDEKYQLKALYQKFGEALFEKEAYWHGTTAIPEEADIIKEKDNILCENYELTAIIALDISSNLMIYKEVVSNDLFYYSRWWQFIDIMQGNDFYYDEKELLEFFNAIRNSTLALGGDKAYYVNDQCTHLGGVGQGEEMEYSWDALEEYIHSREKLEVVSISKIRTDKAYQREINAINHRNLAFYDDFEDSNHH